MFDDTRRAITAPFFEIGPKNLLRLPEMIELATAAQAASAEFRVSVILTAPTASIAAIRTTVPDILVFAQTMDDDELGPSVGRVTAESLADIATDGVMLNHDSHPLTDVLLDRTVCRAHANGLMTMVCAGTESEAIELAEMRPTVILFEPPALIGRTDGQARPWIPSVNARVRSRSPTVLLMHAGGVATPTDAFQIMRSGADGTGSTSGVLRADSPPIAVREFIAAVREGFDEHNNLAP